jgi:hypothetical protein
MKLKPVRVPTRAPLSDTIAKCVLIAMGIAVVGYAVYDHRYA